MINASVHKQTSRVHRTIFLLHPGHYFSLDNDLIDQHAKTLGLIGVGLYAALARYANRKTGECWPSIRRLATQFDCARSTIKTHLRKLVEVGLITITRRRHDAGDATSHLYTLLDPSPAAIDRRRTAHEAAVAAAPEGGGLTADPPRADCRPTGGLTADPEPSSPEHTEENQAGGGSGEQREEETTPQANPCSHPREERMTFGAVTVCGHCYRMIEVNTAPAEGHDCAEEGQAFAACAA